VDSHRRAGESVERIRSFLAWPLHLNLAASERAQFRQIARFERIPPPVDLGIDPRTFLAPDSAEHRYVWARCLSHMRETMNREIDARVCLGGQVTGYKGKYPGLVEEALLALQAGKPLYLIGAFGGCARALIEAVEGGRPAALTGGVQLGDADYAASVALYNQRAAAVGEAPVDYKGLLAFLQGRGIAGLNNGLDAVENRRLFATPHIPEMVALVLRGLAGVYGVANQQS